MKTECISRIGLCNPRGLIRFALYAAGLVFASASMSSAIAGDNPAAELSHSVPAHAPGRWRATGDLITARELHRATLLPNGQVLVAGGLAADYVTALASAELVRSGDWGVDADRQHGQWTLLSHDDVTAEWAGAGC